MLETSAKCNNCNGVGELLFEAALDRWLEGAQAIVNASRTFVKGPLSLKRGKRYVRVIKTTSYREVYAFIDTANGDVLKPASWRTPAKHARGNIFDSNGSLGSLNGHGPAYLR